MFANLFIPNWHIVSTLSATNLSHTTVYRIKFTVFCVNYTVNNIQLRSVINLSQFSNDTNTISNIITYNTIVMDTYTKKRNHTGRFWKIMICLVRLPIWFDWKIKVLLWELLRCEKKKRKEIRYESVNFRLKYVHQCRYQS